MISIDYGKMIDAYSEGALRHCIDLLFELFNFRFLTPADIRRIDLKEKVYALAEEYAPGKGKDKEAPTAIKYAEALDFPFDNGYMPCEKGSIAEAYSKRAIELIKRVKEKKADMEDLEDLFMVYTCLSREIIPSLKAKKKASASSVSFGVKKKDAALFAELRGFPFKTQTPIAALSTNQSEKQKQFAYLNNILFYIRLMDYQGEYVKGSES